MEKKQEKPAAPAKKEEPAAPKPEPVSIAKEEPAKKPEVKKDHEAWLPKPEKVATSEPIKLPQPDKELMTNKKPESKHHHHHKKAHAKHGKTLLQVSSHNHAHQDFYDDDPLLGGEEAEDAEVLKSLAYAEKKLGKKMDTPKVLASTRGMIQYDVEKMAGDSTDRISIGKELSGMVQSKEEASYMGDCDANDEHCLQNAFRKDEQKAKAKLAEAVQRADDEATVLKAIRGQLANVQAQEQAQAKKVAAVQKQLVVAAKGEAQDSALSRGEVEARGWSKRCRSL